MSTFLYQRFLRGLIVDMEAMGTKFFDRHWPNGLYHLGLAKTLYDTRPPRDPNSYLKMLAARYDTAEVAYAVLYQDAKGDEYWESYDSIKEANRAKADSPDAVVDECWAIYGHQRTGGVLCFADCETEEAAHFLQEAVNLAIRSIIPAQEVTR